MTISGVLVAGFSVGMFNFSNFGMDPFQVFAHGVWKHMPIGYGTFYTILNLIMLIFIFMIDRHKIGLATVINIFLLGYVVEFSSLFFNTQIPNPTFGIRILFLIVGIIILSFGSSLYFIGELGVSTYDAVALILSERELVRVSPHGPEALALGLAYKTCYFPFMVGNHPPIGCYSHNYIVLLHRKKK